MREVVTTLPITVRPEMSAARIQSIITGGLLAHHLDADLAVWQGLNGRASDTSSSGQNTFSSIIEAYGPKDSTYIFSDTDPEFISFVQHSTHKLIDSGLIGTQDIEQLVCDCGIVHIEKVAVQETRPDKLKNIELRLGTFTCKHCLSSLNETRSPQLVTTAKLYEGLDVSLQNFPQHTVQAKVSSVVKESATRRKILTRTDKSTGLRFQLDATEFVLDPDFTLQFAPLYASNEEKLVTLVAGPRQLEKAVGSTALFSAFQQSHHIRNLIHPRIFVQPDNKALSMPVATERSSVIQHRLITSASLLWNNHESTLSIGDYSMLMKMTEAIQALQVASAVNPQGNKSLADFMQLYSPQSIRKLLKNIRKGEIADDSDEAALISDILAA